MELCLMSMVAASSCKHGTNMIGVHTSTASSGRLRPPGEEDTSASESFFGSTGPCSDLVRAQLRPRCEAVVFSSAGMRSSVRGRLRGRERARGGERRGWGGKRDRY
eukprot:scaffold37711_cov48-Phaeocystis_antarctica.AAC.1